MIPYEEYRKMVDQLINLRRLLFVGVLPDVEESRKIINNLEENIKAIDEIDMSYAIKYADEMR